jgi:predicted NAD/FAD-binding protein
MNKIVVEEDNDENGERTSIKYELFTRTTTTMEEEEKDDGLQSVGIYDDVIFACHTDTATSILKSCTTTMVDPTLIATVAQIEYANNIVYVHSDPKLMPLRRRAWASWNCLGNSQYIQEAIGIGGGNGKMGGNASTAVTTNNNKHKGGAMEGAESGFGNTIASSRNTTTNVTSTEDSTALEGKDGRMKAVYVTYWLNRLQNLNTSATTTETTDTTNIFVSLNPHTPPKSSLTYKRTHLSHPQFTPTTIRARNALNASYQGTDGLWFCGAYMGYGFHEDGCRSGLDVATKISNIPVPWCVTKTNTDTKTKKDKDTDDDDDDDTNR